MAMPRKRPLEDKQQYYVYIWRLRSKVVLVGYGKDNRGRPEVRPTGRSVACMEMLSVYKLKIKWEVLPCSSKEQARTLERKLIAKFKPKYNTTPGCGGYKGMHTAKGLAGIRAASLSRKHSSEFIDTMSKRLVGNTYALGYKHSPETIEKIREAGTGRSASSLCKKKARERAIERNKGNSFAKGYKWTDEQRSNLRAAIANRKVNK